MTNVAIAPFTDLGTVANVVVQKADAARKAAKISKPGVYEIPIETYHSDCCAGPSISSSGLRTIENESPAHYWATSYLNPDRKVEAEKPHFSLGRAAHTLLLGESGFREQFAIRPDQFPDWRTKASQQWRDEMIAAGRTVLTPADIETIRGMASSLAAHPIVQAGILSGKIEQSIIWQDKETGVWLKARPDALPLDGNLIADLKTTSNAHPDAVRRSVFDFGYHMQLALVGMGMEAVLDRRPGNDDYALIFVETKSPWAVNVAPIDIAAIDMGRRQLRRAIRRFADCLSKNQWPGYEGETTVSLPDWLNKRLEREIESGLLPDAA